MTYNLGGTELCLGGATGIQVSTAGLARVPSACARRGGKPKWKTRLVFKRGILRGLWD